MDDTGTVDITNLVNQIQSVWIDWAVTTVMGAVVLNPWSAWLAWPIIGAITRTIVRLIATKLSGETEQLAFFINTAIKKAGQAKDFTSAVSYLQNLPPTVSNKEYEDAEKAQMRAFRNFVVLTD